MWKIQLFKLNFDGRESDAAREVIESGWLTMGEKTSSFESSFGNFLGSSIYATAVSNGTAALHMALLALNIRSGDEVIIPALTFVADANVVYLVGATPIIADCGSLDNWNMTAETIAQKITAKTKAVIVVHYAGYPCDMPSIKKLCTDRGIHLIEDVAHAPGASIDGKSCGAWGDIGCFSFFSNKNLSLGEGGMVTTTNEKLNQRLRYLRSHGMTTLTLDRHKGRAITYDVIEPGLNYRMDEVRAAIGLVQLDKLPSSNLSRKHLTDRYRDNLKGTEVLIPFSQPYGAMSLSSYHILPILLPKKVDRKEVIEKLKQKGIQSSIHYPPFWDFTAYAGQFKPTDAPIVAEISQRQLTLPLFPTMRIDEVDEVTLALLGAIN